MDERQYKKESQEGVQSPPFARIQLIAVGYPGLWAIAFQAMKMTMPATCILSPIRRYPQLFALYPIQGQFCHNFIEASGVVCGLIPPTIHPFSPPYQGGAGGGSAIIRQSVCHPLTNGYSHPAALTHPRRTSLRAGSVQSPTSQVAFYYKKPNEIIL
jgi:hypothetical protein